MGLGDIEAYTYQADLHCGWCIRRKLQAPEGLFTVSFGTEDYLDRLALIRRVNRRDESSFDHADFPKVVLGQDLNDGDYDHCGWCGDCLGHDLSDCETEDDEDMPQHADYPHEPGRLYDCPRCEHECHCSHLPGKTECVFCELLRERHQTQDV